MWLGQFLGWLGIAVAAVLTGLLFFLYKRNEEAWNVFAGAAPRETAPTGTAKKAPAAGR